MPLPSGPDGGDVIAANEILNSLLHEVIFFQDPLEAHPHSEDVRYKSHSDEIRTCVRVAVSVLADFPRLRAGTKGRSAGTKDGMVANWKATHARWEQA